MISIFDYGAGNLRSVANTLDAIGAPHELIHDADGIARATQIVLPGVGHFGQMMRALDRLEVRAALIDRIRAGLPFLGICLGLQALFASSEEAPEAHGLGIFDGAVQRFSGNQRIPHMGWNNLERRSGASCGSRLLEKTGDRPYVYFANSYFAPVVEAASATCDYGGEFSAVIERGNLFAVQFHPEKSGPVGLQIVRNFASICQ